MSLGDGDLNLPYEEIPEGPVPLDLDAVYCGGMVVRAATAVIDTVGKVPLLVFDFKTATGVSLPSVALVLGVEEMRAVPRLVRRAADAAIVEASR